MNLPTLETTRMIIRQLELSDAEAVFNYASNPNITKFVTWNTHNNLSDSIDYIKFAQENYQQGLCDPMGLTLKTNPSVVIGSVGAFWSSHEPGIMELGACIGEVHWGQGLAHEALAELIDYVWKNYDVIRIQSRCKLGNTQSHRMMEKLGMKFEGVQRSSLKAKGESWDMEIFSLINK
ncbi:MAG TPA: GNAT family N-acetyltransferase [Bacteriovoracaceae bacterium]|nr:GNAT family N-acetyltransferase [Bacteriovoracaceae bacterium]